MRQFDMHNPRTPQSEQNTLKVFDNPKGNGENYYFAKQGDHLLIYNERLHTYPATAGRGRAGRTELFNYQFEMPISAIRWFVDVIENRFFKSPNEGGLPADKLSFKEEVGGESLHVMRTMGGGDRPGYVITNASRRSHFTGRNMQELHLSDRWLFQDGLMDYLKELADKFENGQL